MQISLHPTRVHAVVTVHTRDTSQWFPPAKFPDYVPQVCAKMEANPADVIEISFDGAAAAQPFYVHVTSADVGLLQFEADYPRPADAKTMQVWSKHLVRLPRGHQQLLFIIDGADTLLEDTLTTDHDSAVVDLPTHSTTTRTATTTAPAPPRISFFLLGVRHIVTGYDHLLFLAAILLVCKTFRQAAAVITFFTVAHSITLTLAALDIVRLPGRIVEPAIAASIVYVGLENIFGRHRFLWRAAITFAFGLVHGLGFASALREVGLGSKNIGIVMPLLKFAIGLETGQLAIAVVLLQILLTLRKRPIYQQKIIPIASIIISLIGAYWLVTRLLAG